MGLATPTLFIACFKRKTSFGSSSTCSIVFMVLIPSVTESKFAPFAEFRFKAAAAGALRLILSFDVFIKSRIGPKAERTYYGVNRGGVPPEGRRSLAASGISPRGRRE